MVPEMGHPNGGTALACGFGQPVIALDLQDTVEACKEGFGIRARPTGCIEVNHTGRIFTAPCAVIVGQCPEIASFGFTAPRIQHRGGGFVDYPAGDCAAEMTRLPPDHHDLSRSPQAASRPVPAKRKFL